LATTLAPTTSPYDYYETCFQECTTDLQPSDWTERWHTTVAASSVLADAACIGGKKLYTTHSSNDRYYLSWDSPSGPDYIYDNEVEILAKVRSPSDSKWVVRLIIHGTGSDSNEDGYLLDLHINTDEIEIAEFSNGSPTVHKTESMSLAVDTWYWMRFRREGSALKGKVWVAGAAEPGAWSIEATDSSNNEGRCGIGSGTGDHYCDWFSVCVGGGTARGPQDIPGCTTLAPTTIVTTASPPTTVPTTLPTTAAPTTVPTTIPTTLAPTTIPTTTSPTTYHLSTPPVQTTLPPTTKPQLTTIPTTAEPTTTISTAAPTTSAPTTVPTTIAPTTIPTTLATTTIPTTVAPTTVPTTVSPTTVPTTLAPTTLPTTLAPTTIVTTAAPTTVSPIICNRYFLSPITKEILIDGNLCR